MTAREVAAWADESLQQEGIEAHAPEVRALDREAEPGTGRPEHRQQAEPAAGEVQTVRRGLTSEDLRARCGLGVLSWSDRKSLERFNSAVMWLVYVCVPVQ